MNGFPRHKNSQRMFSCRSSSITHFGGCSIIGHLNGILDPKVLNIDGSIFLGVPGMVPQ